MVALLGYGSGTIFFTIWITILYIANFAIAVMIIFHESKNPDATMSWILVLFLVPILGIILYVLFSQNISRKRIFTLTKDEAHLMTSALRKQEAAIAKGSYPFDSSVAEKWKDLIRLNQVYGRAYYSQDNQMTIQTSGRQLADVMYRDIAEAKESIHIMFFIIKPDEEGKRLVDALTTKALEGVKVRLLVDALGSRHFSDRMVTKLIAAGGEFATFFPPKFRLFRYVNPKLNFRNHRKLMVIDNTIGYIGGFNIAREYMGAKKKFGFWRDTHARIEGGAVQDINLRFLQDWRASSKEKVDLSGVFFEPEKVAGTTGMQIVSCGPETQHDEVKRAFMKMITSARKNIYIQTPYFVPDGPILESLKMAALSGVDVRIMIPCRPDHIFVYWATYKYCGELLNDGGRIFIYDNGFLHSKTMVVDGEVATIGSTNFDVRSFKLNFECNSFIYDEREAKKMEAIFEKDMEHGHELTQELYDQRSLWIRIKEPIARLLSNVL